MAMRKSLSSLNPKALRGWREAPLRCADPLRPRVSPNLTSSGSTLPFLTSRRLPPTPLLNALPLCRCKRDLQCAFCRGRNFLCPVACQARFYRENDTVRRDGAVTTSVDLCDDESACVFSSKRQFEFFKCKFVGAPRQSPTSKTWRKKHNRTR